MFNEKCPRCARTLEQTNATLNLTHDKVHFCSWLCRDCGTRVETRKIGKEPVEELLVSQPRPVVDVAAQDRMERVAVGCREWCVKH